MRRFKIVQMKGAEFPFFIYEKKHFRYKPTTGNLSGAFTSFQGAVIEIKKKTAGNVIIKGKWSISTCTPKKEKR